MIDRLIERLTRWHNERAKARMVERKELDKARLQARLLALSIRRVV